MSHVAFREAPRAESISRLQISSFHKLFWVLLGSTKFHPTPGDPCVKSLSKACQWSLRASLGVRRRKALGDPLRAGNSSTHRTENEELG